MNLVIHRQFVLKNLLYHQVSNMLIHKLKHASFEYIAENFMQFELYLITVMM